jgi:hypothetical protein
LQNPHCTQNPGLRVKTCNGLVTTAEFRFAGDSATISFVA